MYETRIGRSLFFQKKEQSGSSSPNYLVHVHTYRILFSQKASKRNPNAFALHLLHQIFECFSFWTGQFITKKRVLFFFSFEYIPHFVSELLDLVLECLILCLFCLCEPSAFCLPTNKNESYALLSKVSGMSLLDSVSSSTSFTSKKLSLFLPKLGQNK